MAARGQYRASDDVIEPAQAEAMAPLVPDARVRWSEESVLLPLLLVRLKSQARAALGQATRYVDRLSWTDLASLFRLSA